MELRLTEKLKAQVREIERSEPGVRAGNDPDSVHDFRVAVRRIRVLMRMFRPGLSEEADARWLGRVLGEARDRDVQLEALQAECARDADLERLVGGLLRERIATQRAVVEALDSERYTRLRASIDKIEINESPLDPEELAQKARRQVKDAAKKLSEKSPATDFHRLRKRVKRQRYVLEFLAPILGEKSERAIKDLKELQDELGNRQDAITLSETLHRLLHEPDLSPQAVRAAERLLGELEVRERRARKRVLRCI